MGSKTRQVYRPLEDKQYRSWLSITPVANLEFDRGALKTGELKIGGIHLMDLQRLKNVARRRWAMPAGIFALASTGCSSPPTRKLARQGLAST